MSTQREVVGYLVFRKVIVQNANAISSPITYGFPSVTGFLGAFHAMSRKVQSHLNEYCLGGVLLACHDCQVQAYRTARYSNYTFNQSRNPIKKDGKTASIIEEGKCHLVMSFVVELLGEDEPSDEHISTLTAQTEIWIQQSRIAGGSVHGLASTDPVQFVSYEDLHTIAPLLRPAFVLMDAQTELTELIDQAQAEDPSASPLDVLLDVGTIHHTPEVQKNDTVTWSANSIKHGRGWLVPMPIGYQAISPLFDAGTTQNARNPEYASQYVEAIYGLGQWVYPQRLSNEDRLDQGFWRYQHDTTNDLYLVNQHSTL